MNPVDLGLLIVVLLFALVGLRGLVREVLGLVAWIVAGMAGVALAQFFVQPVSHVVRNSALVDAAAFSIPFLIVLVILSLVAGACSAMMRRTPLSGLDRILGFLFAGAKGAALIVLLFVVFTRLVPHSDWPPALQEARSLPFVQQGAEWASAQLPPQYRPGAAAPADTDPEALPGEGAGPGTSTGLIPIPSRKFGHPFGADPHVHVPNYTPGPGN